MTHDEIDKLEAGLRLDALVAKEVMGWLILEMPNAFGRPFLKEEHWFHNGEHYWCEDGKLLSQIFDPSASISAAWELADQPWPITIRKYPIDESNDQWEVVIFNMPGGVHFTAIAPTAPLAICRAALKAVSA